MLDLAMALQALRAEERQQRLQELRESDPLQADSIEQLLGTLAQETQGATGSLAAPTPELSVLGPFKLIELLGRGGMGAVYLAEQDHPRRRVALKLMRSEWVGSDDLKRFMREAGFLAKLSHPAIARVLEAGQLRGTLGPLPYLAMEYVQGSGLIEHARTLSLNARVSLIVSICRAVLHAHVRGVIHRDLKPDNILIDQAGQPKILDFGIAKAIEIDDDPTAPNTMAGHIIGTPGYMSPEQLAGAHIDLRADVYSLGAIAYEVLSGGIRVRDFAGKSLADAQLLMRQSPVSLAQHNPQTQGDLNTVVMKALCAEPERRYQTAAEFADDLERVLERRPIAARPPSLAYVAGRFVVRNWLPIGVGSAVAVLLLVATVVSLRFAQDADRARAEAQTQASIANEVNGFLRNMLSSANPRATADRPTTLLDMVDRARDELPRRRLSDAVELELRRTLLDTYRGLSQSQAALAQADVLLARAKDAPTRLDALLLRASLLSELQQQDQTHAALVEAEKLFASMPVAPLGTERRLALERARWHTRGGRFGEALKTFDMALALGAQDLGASSPELFAIRSDRLNVLADLGQIKDALQQAEALISDVEAAHGADHPEALILRNDRATLFHTMGDSASAAREMEDIAQQADSVFGPDHEFTLTTLHNLAALEIQRGNRQRALELLTLKRDRMQGRYAPDHLKLINTESSLAVVAAQLGQPAEAERIYIDLLSRWPATKQGLPAEIATVLFNLARLRDDQDRWTEAQQDFESLIARMRAANLGDSVALARYRVDFANRLLRQGNRQRALEELDAAEQRLIEELPAEHPSRTLAAGLRQRLTAG